MLRYQYRDLAMLSILASALLLSGCTAGSIVRTICATKTGEKDYSTRKYEVELTVTTDSGRTSTTRYFECTPTGYYCGGGEWYPQFTNKPDEPFTFNVPLGEVLIPLPSCGVSENIGPERTEIDRWPITTLYVGEDTFVINSTEIRQSSALRLIGIRAESYKQRRVIEE